MRGFLIRVSVLAALTTIISVFGGREVNQRGWSASSNTNPSLWLDVVAGLVFMGPLAIAIAIGARHRYVFAVASVVHVALYAWMWSDYLSEETAGDGLVFATGWIVAVPAAVLAAFAVRRRPPTHPPENDDDPTA